MGCEQSKAIRVQPIGPAAIKHDNTDSVEICDFGTQTRVKSGNERVEYELDDQGNKVRRIRKKKKSKSAKSRDSLDSCDSLVDEPSLESDRGFSAGSKKSADSGLGECDEYGHVITEFSNHTEVQRIENEFGDEKELDLMVTGSACPRRMSAKDKNRQHESMILQTLREEGFIAKPKAESSGGVSFEIVSKEEGMIRPPPRLEKLSKKRKKKKVLTEEEIQQKLERAEKRRKKKEQEKLDKIKEIDKSDHLAALDSFAQHQKEKVEQASNKMDSVLDNREKRLKEIREKIKAKERHAEEVRKRKLAAIVDPASTPVTEIGADENEGVKKTAFQPVFD